MSSKPFVAGMPEANLADWYVWLKAGHILAVIAWMAGLFYLPRLMVYHSGSRVGSETSELFKVMERRLLKAIMRPAAAVTWILGLWTATAGGWFSSGDWWLWAKLLLVIALTGVHAVLERHSADFSHDRRNRTERYFRVLNEVPTVLLLGIVILVVVKPF